MNALSPMRLMPPAPLDLRIVFISTYPPKLCGIGTYTKDLASSINNLNADHLAEIIALDDEISESLTYPWEVSNRIRKQEWSDYEKVLTYLNNSVIDIVSIQHEYGIFGGKDGEYIVDFVKKLKKPFIVTLHTILESPSPNQKRIIQEICSRAHAVVVMLSVAADILRDHYGVTHQKIVPIHHGTPDFPFIDHDEMKVDLGFENRILMSSVNLISPAKSLEYAIQALPRVVKKYPNFLYLIVGQTHPNTSAWEGEKYRHKLERLVRQLGLKDNVKFVNKYVTLEKLIDYVLASDFYITPYASLEQISSGSLAYAIAAGKLCISTPYRYAQEMLGGGRGFLVQPQESEPIADAILYALSHKTDANRMRRKCYAQGRKMTWARVGFGYVRMMDHLIDAKNKAIFYDPPRLSYVRFMTDERGILEHSIGDKRNGKEGYAVDDNARALMVAVQYGDKKLAARYLDFLTKAEVNGSLHCDMDYRGRWHQKPGAGTQSTPGAGSHVAPGDWFGRALWALAYTMRFAPTRSIGEKATILLRKLLPTSEKCKYLQTQAYILLTLAELKEYEWDECHELRETLLERGLSAIQSAYKKESTTSWHWVESSIRYDSTRIPQALLEIVHAYGREDLKSFGLQLLDFLLDETFDVLQNHFRFAGNKGWYQKGGDKALFDEQPIEAGGMVQACFAAFRCTGIGYYRDMAYKAFAWFHGDNIMRRPLYNERRASVYDGIMADGLNINQGAECILEYLLAYKCYAKLVEEGRKTSDSAFAT